MPVKGGRHTYLYVLMDVGEMFHDSGEVAAEVQAEREEVRNDQYATNAGFGKTGDGFTQVGVVRLQEGHLGALELAGARCRTGDCPDGLVGGMNTRSVGEDDDARTHAVP